MTIQIFIHRKYRPWHYLPLISTPPLSNISVLFFDSFRALLIMFWDIGDIGAMFLGSFGSYYWGILRVFFLLSGHFWKDKTE